jgi:hypothetical protein
VDSEIANYVDWLMQYVYSAKQNWGFILLADEEFAFVSWGQ